MGNNVFHSDFDCDMVTWLKSFCISETAETFTHNGMLRKAKKPKRVGAEVLWLVDERGQRRISQTALS